MARVDGVSTKKKIGIGIAIVVIVGGIIGIVGQTGEKAEEVVSKDKPIVEESEEPNKEVDKNTNTEDSKDGSGALYDADGIKVLFDGLGEDVLGPEIKLKIENNNGEEAVVQVKEVSINGNAMKGIFSANIEAEKKVDEKITIRESFLEENNIKKIEEIELKISIVDKEDFRNSKDSDIIKIKL